MTAQTLLCLLLATLHFSRNAGAQVYQMGAKEEEIYHQILRLQTPEALSLLEQSQREQPQNLALLHLQHLAEFLQVFVGEQENDYQQLIKNSKQRVQALQKLSGEDPHKRFAMADILLQNALCRLKFGDFISSFTEVRRAYQLLEENQRKFPAFLKNQRNFYLLQSLLGGLPPNLHWGLSLAGMKPDIKGGIQGLERILLSSAHQGEAFYLETLVFYSYVQLHLGNDAEMAWSTLQKTGLKAEASPLLTFVFANVALHSGRNDWAIALLSHRNYPFQHFALPYLDYMLGTAKMHRLDRDAHLPLLRFVQAFEGNNYLKSAYLYLAWHSLLWDRGARIPHYSLQIQHRGKALVEEDQQALREKEGLAGLPADLLRARLLMNGHYFRESLALLQSFQPLSQEQSLESLYRQARCLEQLGDIPKALNLYQEVIDKGKNSPRYFACKSALQIAYLYEQNKQFKEAEQYYGQALQIKPKEYRSGMHQKALIGLQRVQSKP
jgi:hypothetical protein